MKKILTILLSLFILLGCSPTEKPVEQVDYGRKYIDLIKNYEVGKRNKNNTVDNKEFSALLDQIFIDSLEGDYLNLHYNLVDYKQYGIEKPELTLGEIKYEEHPDITEVEEELAKIQAFDFNSLSYQQQIDYDVLVYSYYESLAQAYYAHLDPIFSMGTDLASNLITNFYEFSFYTQEDIDDYLVLLTDIDRYIDDALVYTAEQAKHEIYTTDEGLDYTIEYCEDFVEKIDDNALILTFNNRVEALDYLSAEQKENYKEQNKKIILEEVIPAYQKIADELEQYKGKVKVGDRALCKINEDYAELTYYLKSSNNKDINTVLNDVKKQMRSSIKSFATALNVSEQANYDEVVQNKNYENGSPFTMNSLSEIIDYIYSAMSEYYPEIGEITYEASELDASVASDNVLAYYLTAPIDEPNKNVIRTNPNNIGKDALETYSTLAHEGVPGHMYQNYFYSQTNPARIRYLQNFIAYTEGYAVTAQLDSYDMCGFVSERIGPKAFFNEYYYHILYSALDIGINYKGWTTDEVETYLDTLGIFNKMKGSGAGAEFTGFLTDLPGVYCSYGVGYTNFMLLRTKVKEALGNKFDMVEYNTKILECGPMPFNILESVIDDYIEDKLAQ